MKIVTILILFPAFIALGIFSLNGVQDKEVLKKSSNLTGEQLYAKYCLACHQADGNGVRNLFPPLAGNEKITGSPKDPITIVLFGLTGPIEVNGKEYNQVMPAQDYLTDKQIADVLTFIRSTWGNKASSVKPEDVGKIRKAGKPPE